MAPNTKNSHRQQSGFTLVELGVVIAVILTLMTVALVGRGMLQSARVASAAQLTDTMRKAARACAERRGQANFTGCGLGVLQNPPYNLLPNPVDNPFDSLLAQPGLVPTGVGNTFIQISITTANAAQRLDLMAQLNKMRAGTVASMGPVVILTTR